MASTITNIIKGIRKKANSIAGNPYKKLGISWLDLRLLKNNTKKSLYRQKFLSGFIEFKSVPEFIHALDEIFVTEIYKLPLLKSPRILDCGGNIGISSIYFKHNFPDAKITVFEPDYSNFQLLQRNLELQNCKDVEARKEAIWIENTTLVFQSEGSMSSKIADSSNVNDSGIEVPAMRLRDFITEKIDLLKMDIEGAEYNVVKDIRDRLHLVDNIFIEYHGLYCQQNELIEILNWVRDAGYYFYIKEAHNVYPYPFVTAINDKCNYDVQLNIFGFKSQIT